MPGSPPCPSSHTSVTAHVLGHINGSRATGNHTKTGSTKDAGQPQNLLLGMQTPQGDWGCVSAGCWHSTDEHWGSLLRKPLSSPRREEESCGHCCVLLLWNNAHAGMGRTVAATTGHQSSKSDVGGILGSLGAENSFASSPDLCCH